MRDLIVFGEDFGGLPSSTQHLVKHLAKERKVIWVNSIGLRQPRLNQHDIQRAFSKLMGHSKQGLSNQSSAYENITVVNIRTIPAPKSRFAREVAKSMMLHQLLPILKQHKIEKPILWASLPTVADLCGCLNESGVVYYCGDDFSALEGVDHDVVSQHENELVKKSNLIFSSSKNLCQKFPKSKTQFLPHGVDFELFSEPTERAEDLPKGGKPIAGFYGSLSSWLDYQMINYVALSMPHWEFIFIGPNELSYYPLPLVDNIHYLGPKPHHELPKYSQHWHASLLPFKANKQIEACNPLKLMEYLATGTPIIATPFPALEPFVKHINVVDTPQEMAQALNLAAYQPRLPKDLVKSHSWNARSQLVSWMLDSL